MREGDEFFLYSRGGMGQEKRLFFNVMQVSVILVYCKNLYLHPKDCTE